MPEELDHPIRPVHLLIHEDFFLTKVDAAVRALEKEPLVPSWNEDVLEQLAVAPDAEVVVDLELDAIDVPALLRAVRADSRTAGLQILGYCSHNLTELIDQAQGLGVQVVVRSTFAANLVRLLQELFRSSAEPAGDPEE